MKKLLLAATVSTFAFVGIANATDVDVSQHTTVGASSSSGSTATGGTAFGGSGGTGVGGTGGTGIGTGFGGTGGSSSSHSGAVSGGNRISQAQGQDQDLQSNPSLDGGDNKVNAVGVSYVDSAIGVPQAAINREVYITSSNLKVLGPIFGYAWQEGNYTPEGMLALTNLAYGAVTNDGTPTGEQRQLAHITVICAHDESLAKQLKFGCE